jgi:hypothetical protein
MMDDAASPEEDDERGFLFESKELGRSSWMCPRLFNDEPQLKPTERLALPSSCTFFVGLTL